MIDNANSNRRCHALPYLPFKVYVCYLFTLFRNVSQDDDDGCDDVKGGKNNDDSGPQSDNEPFLDVEEDVEDDLPDKSVEEENIKQAQEKDSSNTSDTVNAGELLIASR